jgi:predicted N-acyltransferase
MGQSMLFKFARLHDRIVAVAVFFVGRDTLYGLATGARSTCTSTACISKPVITKASSSASSAASRASNRVRKANTKSAGGFRKNPLAMVHSAHRIREPRFRAAIADFLRPRKGQRSTITPPASA